MLNRDKNVCPGGLRDRHTTKITNDTGDGYFKKPASLLLLLTILLTAGSAWAQRILTLDEAISNTLQKNYDIILSKNDSAIAAIDYSYRNAAFLPLSTATR